MKAALILLIAIIAIVLALFFFGSTPRPASPPGTGAGSATQQRPRSTSTVREDVESVVNYGTGYTQLKVKQNATTRLDNLSANRDQEIGDRAK